MGRSGARGGKEAEGELRGRDGSREQLAVQMSSNSLPAALLPSFGAHGSSETALSFPPSLQHLPSHHDGGINNPALEAKKADLSRPSPSFPSLLSFSSLPPSPTVPI